MTNYQHVSARALIARLNVSAWTARKFDRNASDDVNTKNHARSDASRVNKYLLAGSAEHEAVLDATRTARLVHDGQTLPWGDNGDRLLPVANYFTYVERMRKEHLAWQVAVEKFMQAYPTLRASAEQALGTLWADSEYPKASEVRHKFAWHLSFDPVPDAGDIRVDLPDDQRSAIEASITERVEATVRVAMEDAWKRLYDAVARVKKATDVRDNGKKGIVRDTLVENIQEVVDVLPRINVSEDADLSEMVARVERELGTLSVEDLRSDDKLRAQAQKEASAIMDAMKAFYGPTVADDAAA